MPGVDGRPTIQPNLIEEGFPLVRPNWDFKRAEGKERLRVYRQTLMAGLRGAAKKPTNLAKINPVRQPVTLKKLKLNGSMKTYKTFQN